MIHDGKKFSISIDFFETVFGLKQKIGMLLGTPIKN